MILNMLALVMIGKINQKLPEDQRVGYFGWSSRIKKQYRALYPESRWLLAVRTCEILMFASFALLVWIIFKG
ncbi:MAG: hypothetical protein ABSF92_06025 [Candidatus Acidiferrales bacterium]